MPSGPPGCPSLAVAIESRASARSVLIARKSWEFDINGIVTPKGFQCLCLEQRRAARGREVPGRSFMIDGVGYPCKRPFRIRSHAPGGGFLRVLLAGLSLARIASRPSCKYDSASGITQSLQEFEGAAAKWSDRGWRKSSEKWKVESASGSSFIFPL